MSATQTSTYTNYIEQLKDCRATCESCLAETTVEEACHFTLRQAVAALRIAISKMEAGDDADRALVDCADTCELAADRCDNTTHPQVKVTVTNCRVAAQLCREASM